MPNVSLSALSWYLPPAATLLGLVLFIYGRRGRRKGADPHCRKCDYNLTGLTSERCPECGSVIAKVGVRRGARTRRSAWSLLGLSLFLLSGTALSVKGVRWFRSMDYPDLPTW